MGDEDLGREIDQFIDRNADARLFGDFDVLGCGLPERPEMARSEWHFTEGAEPAPRCQRRPHRANPTV
jgi:hypothetical protein